MVNFWKNYGLLIVVFITGAAVLILEITATRILSPYFGNTIYTVSSVIGIILAALSLGYFIGGRFADEHAKLEWFFGIIIAGGLGTLWLLILVTTVLPASGHNFPLTIGPLLWSILLFFLPSFLLGTLSPYAIKLQELLRPNDGIGRLSGEIFFWSTFGSIFGSLFAGFYLIPTMGIDQIVLSVALSLIVLGGIGMSFSNRALKGVLLFVIVILLLSFAATTFLHIQSARDYVYEQDGIYEHLAIYDDEYEGRPARFFEQDKSLSGVMFLDGDDLAVDYTKYYSLYKLFKPELERALVIGGGAYSIPKALLADLPDVVVDAVEIEPSLPELSEKYFQVPNTPRLKHLIEDGRRFLHDTDNTYGLIYSDVYYSLFSIPSHFTTVEFFESAKSRLDDGGIFVANLIGDLSREDDSFIFSELRTFRKVFPNSYYFAIVSPTSLEVQNIVILGINSDTPYDFSDPSLREHDDPIIKTLGEKLVNIDRYNLEEYPLMTDNYAPVEHLVSKFIKRAMNPQPNIFSGEEALALIAQQLSYGDRYLSSSERAKAQEFYVTELGELTDTVRTQSWVHGASNGDTYEMMNIIAQIAPEKEHRILLGAHYDNRRFADRSLLFPNDVVPGANDSASGVAVLLEIARFFKNSEHIPDVGVDIVLFDGEEGEEHLGDFEKWVPLGSTYFAEHIDKIYSGSKPEVGIVIDMVCDKDLDIYIEQNSLEYAPEEVSKFWGIATELWPKNFHSNVYNRIGDDHKPLSEAGIPSFLVIDLNYPYWHTTRDTINKCSAKSLRKVGSTILTYIYSL